MRKMGKKMLTTAGYNYMEEGNLLIGLLRN